MVWKRKRDVFIIYNCYIKHEYPLNSRTPSEIHDEHGENMFILSYSKRRKGIESAIETESDNIFDKFRYIPA